jgi:hypothetical protein
MIYTYKNTSENEILMMINGQIVKEVIEKVGESFHLLIRQIIKRKMPVNELKLFSSSHLYQKKNERVRMYTSFSIDGIDISYLYYYNTDLIIIFSTSRDKAIQQHIVWLYICML